MRELEEKAKEDEAGLERKQREKLEAATSQVLGKLPAKPKPSSEVLNLERILRNVVKLKNYSEAHDIQERIQKLQKGDQERWEANKQQKLAYQQTILMKKHATELKAFQKKIQSKIEALKKKRALDLEQLLQKYQNIKKDIDIQNALELKKLQRHSSSSLNVSTYSPKPSTARSSTRKKTKEESPISQPSGN
eukprot:TRINITY_DN9686_c0_g3_i1.p1 TRINITY_DN9686_c0_g3~~TRINITY_DN9686_c0_g3_i1.p1  ORF type:complete len:192 (-),score=71.74 TRINITY_DN9686_c0_g3_i1:122-697(-)